MDIRRVAIIFDDETRPETTGVYCRKALASLVDTRHFHPRDLNRLPRDEFDLYLQIDDGLQYRLPPELPLTAWWAIDTHLNRTWCIKHARDFHQVFTAQRDGALQLLASGIRGVTWLPLACDPDLHGRREVENRYDVCFVGNLFPGRRAELVRRMQQEFPRHFVGQRYFDQMAEVYSASRIVLNQSLENDINMRVFEALASGSLLITNDLADNGLRELFHDGVHLVTFQTPDELVERIHFYLDHPEAREAIARVGRDEVVAHHTYRHRMEKLLRSFRNDQHVERASLSSPRLRTKDPTYFDFARPELLERIPPTANRVLEIGCAAGRLGEALKARQSTEYVGIEQSPDAARRARTVIDQVIEGDIETIPDELDLGLFDCIVCGDVLEHLRRPDLVLRRLRGWLASGGVLVASIPNVRHHSVVQSLLEGNWTYEPAGLLDQTHLRFFTRKNIAQLFEFAGMEVRSIQSVPGPGYAEWDSSGRPNSVRLGRLCVSALPTDDVEGFYVYQYLVTAAPASADITVRRATPRARPTNDRNIAPLRFSRDFISDFEQFDFHGPPFAFVRFGDGERAIAEGKPLDVPRDGWRYDGRQTSFVESLSEALHGIEPDYYIGISDGCCDRSSQQWYLRQIRLPHDRLTFANIFVNWNYRRFQQLDLADAVVVGCEGADFPVPRDILTSGFDIDPLVEKLLAVDRPILVSAGPASAVIIHQYWRRASRKQVIVDVGSAIDERTKGRRTRPYQVPGSRTAELICRW